MPKNRLGLLEAAWREGRLRTAADWRFRRLLSLVASARYLVRNPAAGRVSLLAPDYLRPDPEDEPLIDRLLGAYQRMKADQDQVGALYQPSSLWQGQLDDAYRTLIDGAARSDRAAFHFFLANFGCWRNYTGIESSSAILAADRNVLTRRHMEVDQFYRLLATWTDLTQDPDIRRLSSPRHGNLAGALLDGQFVGLGSFFNSLYASAVLPLVDDRPRPVIAELGAGYGKLAYFVLRDLNQFTYLDFDLPETLTVATYYLAKAFPDKRFLLYGEAPYSAQAHAEYDFILMPSWEMARLGESSVDLFLNKNSLGEMSREAVANYVSLIVRSTRFFFHLNHDSIRNRYADGSTSVLAREYPVPEEQFRLLWRYPDLGHQLYLPSAGATFDIFMYLYERRRDPVVARQRGGALHSGQGA
jgi:putative sugar O-methyltransferase